MPTNLDDRYGVWFGPKGFLGHVDEKERTGTVMQAVLDKLAPVLPAAEPGKPAHYIDAGAGAGNLTRMVIESLRTHYPELKTLAVDNSEFMHTLLAKSVPEAERLVADLGKKLDLAKALGGKAIVTTGSHVGYYPDVAQQQTNGGQFEQFHQNLLNATEAKGVVILIHSPPAFPLESLRDAFSATPEHETVIRQNKMLRQRQEPQVQHYDIQFTSELYFPKLSKQEMDIVWNGIDPAKGPDAYSYDHNPYAAEPSGERMLTARALLEFMIHKGLEDLAPNGRDTYRAYVEEVMLASPLGREVKRDGAEFQVIPVDSLVQVISPSREIGYQRRIEQAVNDARDALLGMEAGVKPLESTYRSTNR